MFLSLVNLDNLFKIMKGLGKERKGLILNSGSLKFTGALRRVDRIPPLRRSTMEAYHTPRLQSLQVPLPAVAEDSTGSSWFQHSAPASPGLNFSMGDIPRLAGPPATARASDIGLVIADEPRKPGPQNSTRQMNRDQLEAEVLAWRTLYGVQRLLVISDRVPEARVLHEAVNGTTRTVSLKYETDTLASLLANIKHVAGTSAGGLNSIGFVDADPTDFVLMKNVVVNDKTLQEMQTCMIFSWRLERCCCHVQSCSFKVPSNAEWQLESPCCHAISSTSTLPRGGSSSMHWSKQQVTMFVQLQTC